MFIEQIQALCKIKTRDEATNLAGTNSKTQRGTDKQRLRKTCTSLIAKPFMRF